MNSAAALAGSRAERGPWRAELTDLVRAASGGLLFGVPLLYTMEVWWVGSHTHPRQMLAVLALLMVPVFILNQTAGFRATRDVRTSDAVADTVEAVAVGLLVTAVVLALLREITFDTPLATGLGKVLYESVPFCLGVGVARHFLAGDRAGSDDDAGQSTAEQSAGESPSTIADLGATVIGAVFISLSIAPTDEVPLIASAMSPAWLLVMMAASLLVSYAIVFAAGFGRQDERHSQVGAFQRPVTETVVCYLLALLTATVLLWLFQRGLQPWTDVVGRVIVLGLPAAVGGAAGRLAI